jgi:regulator of sigma E protease
MLTSIVAAVVILGLLIIVHEAGHFVMAKRLGVRVLRFSIGYPPKVWGIRRGETEYAFGATPLGGYVRMLGDEVGEEPKPEELDIYLTEIGYDLIGAARKRGTIQPGGVYDDQLKLIAERLGAGALGSPAPVAAGGAAALASGLDAGGRVAAAAVIGRELGAVESLLINEIRRCGSPQDARRTLSEHPTPALLDSFRKRAFPTQSLWKRIVIVLAGPASNIIFAPVLLTIVFMWGLPMLLPVVGQVKEGMPAYAAGLRSGDRIIAIDGRPMESWMDFSDTVKSGGGKPLRLEIDRKTGTAIQRSEVTITPRREEQKTVYGTTASEWIIGVLPHGDETIRRLDPFSAGYEAIISTGRMTAQLVTGIAAIVSGATPVRQALGGPIMIAQMAGKEAHEGFASVAMFTVMLSLELGIINLLPVPLLDGGHLLFFAFEGLRGAPLDLRHREIALQVGLFLLVALMAFVIFNDISRIVQG